MGVWILGEFGEMLVNGTCKNPDGNAIVVDDSEIIGVYESILNDHNKKGDRSDIIIMWALTALSKLSIRGSPKLCGAIARPRAPPMGTQKKTTGVS